MNVSLQKKMNAGAERNECQPAKTWMSSRENMDVIPGKNACHPGLDPGSMAPGVAPRRIAAQGRNDKAEGLTRDPWALVSRHDGLRLKAAMTGLGA
jgi:hypothetical protein